VEPEPFHGYFFKILTRQGKSAPGGKYDYIINANMIAGFALVAWPAAYGETGIMTFIVNQQGASIKKTWDPRPQRQRQPWKYMIRTRPGRFPQTELADIWSFHSSSIL